MNILYYGMSGSAANSQLGWLLVCIGIIVMIVGMILLAHFCADDNLLALLIIPTIACIIIGIYNLADSRKPIVKATLDNTISFTEIQEHYDYIGKEGDIYIFRPRNVNIDEWEQLVKEKNN